MTDEQEKKYQNALDMLYSLIEKVNGNGNFKELKHLDAVRQAHTDLTELFTNSKNNQNGK